MSIWPRCIQRIRITFLNRQQNIFFAMLHVTAK